VDASVGGSEDASVGSSVDSDGIEQAEGTAHHHAQSRQLASDPI
jgi:hypothetical protein